LFSAIRVDEIRRPEEVIRLRYEFTRGAHPKDFVGGHVGIVSPPPPPSPAAIGRGG
jgi:hypothetical protein